MISDSIAEADAFQESTDGFNCHNERCPRCGAPGKLSPYSEYRRWLVSTDGKSVMAGRIVPLRFECRSCSKTHALLPDILTPYSPYSLRFKLTVLAAYFEREQTVAAICKRFGIAVSTIYEWKKLFLSHKKLFLGILADRREPALAFLRGLFGDACISGRLEGFFSRYGISFLQARPMPAAHCLPP
jgi:ribosomal protein S27AE